MLYKQGTEDICKMLSTSASDVNNQTFAEMHYCIRCKWWINYAGYKLFVFSWIVTRVYKEKKIAAFPFSMSNKCLQNIGERTSAFQEFNQYLP